MRILRTESEEETINLGKKIGAKLGGGDLLLLKGDLGGGKTTISKGIAAGLGAKEEVTSPTFTIEQIYKGKNDICIFHYDFYRLSGGDITEFELLENLKNDKAVFLVEWPENLEADLPHERIEIILTFINKTVREIQIKTFGAKYKNFLEDI